MLQYVNKMPYCLGITYEIVVPFRTFADKNEVLNYYRNSILSNSFINNYAGDIVHKSQIFHEQFKIRGINFINILGDDGNVNITKMLRALADVTYGYIIFFVVDYHMKEIIGDNNWYQFTMALSQERNKTFRVYKVCE